MNNTNKIERNIMTTITTNELKKGTEIKSTQLGIPVSGVIADNKKGNTRLVEVKGSEVGLFDEVGSVYAYDIKFAKISGQWIRVQHTEKQMKLQELNNSLF